MIEKNFISDSIKREKAKDFIRKEMAKAGIVDVHIQRTTLNTRIIISAERPGIIIGRKGRGILELTQTIERDLGIQNPQIELVDIGNPELEPNVIAMWIARMLERGYKAKKVMQRALYRIKKANAMGAEIIVRGTMHKGIKSRQERVVFGYLKKAGNDTRHVKEAKTQAKLKQGVLGITVRIVPPDVIFADKINIAEIIRKGEENKTEDKNGNNQEERTEKHGESRA